MKKNKILKFVEFEEEVLKEDSFHEAIKTLKWLARVEDDSISFQNKTLREMFVIYLRAHKKVEKDPYRIGSGQTSRRLS
jgi:hypothetical protein